MISRYLYLFICTLCFGGNLFAQKSTLNSKTFWYEKPAATWDKALPGIRHQAQLTLALANEL